MKTILSAVVLALSLPLSASGGNVEDRVASSRDAVRTFQSTLQAELQAAIKSGGPVRAIEVCNKRAPEIAADLSRSAGFSLGRTSLKIRNPRNAPDAWERSVLERFEQRKKKGEDPAELEYYEIVETDGQKEFRYMKAIPVPEGAPCLLCHGAQIDAKVAARLDALYPGDVARGFSTGDLRGAFAVRQPM